MEKIDDEEQWFQGKNYAQTEFFKVTNLPLPNEGLIE